MSLKECGWNKIGWLVQIMIYHAKVKLIHKDGAKTKTKKLLHSKRQRQRDFTQSQIDKKTNTAVCC